MSIFAFMAKTKRERVPKTRGAGTLTESAFWSMIRSALRQKSRWWKPIQLCKQKARRNYKGSNKRQKYEYKCAICEGWFPDKNIEVDHINPAGSLKCGDDLKGFVERLFCEIDNLRVLCKPCHIKITKNGK
jgi:5-methylcytosine-specific restriction endonuclease McrA